MLGTIETCAGGEVLELGPPKQRRELAVLLVHAGQVVPVEQIGRSP